MQIFGIPYLKKGYEIKIKKKNRGSFTEYCGGKVTDECIQKAKKSNNPKLRKKAIFAQNSRSWSKKHEKGGTIKCDDGTIIPKKQLTKDQLLGRTPIIIKGKKLYVRGDGTAKALNHKPGLQKKYEKGDKIHKPFGHRSILDNGWISTKKIKN